MSSDLLNQFEFLLGSIGVTLALFFGVFLLITGKRQPKANVFLAIYLLAFALRIGKSLFHYDFEIPAVVRTHLIATLYLIGPAIWLYSYYLKSSIQVIRLKDWLHYIPFIIFFCGSSFIPNDGSSSLFGWFYDGTILSMSIYIIYSQWWNYTSEKTETSEGAQEIKRWLTFFLFANLFLVAFYFLASKFMISLYGGISISFSLVIVICSVRALRIPSLFKVDKAKYSNSNVSTAVASELASSLELLMQRDRPYIDPELNLNKLSVLLEVNSKELSQVINQVHGKNYAQYIVGYRLQEAKRLLSSADHQHLSIAAIAYDAGFNSISSFNSQFKKQFETTAKEYRSMN